MKPFVETLRVTNPVRQSRASSREASLAWGRVTVTAKRSDTGALRSWRHLETGLRGNDPVLVIWPVVQSN